jgi:hypothetical protein
MAPLKELSITVVCDEESCVAHLESAKIIIAREGKTVMAAVVRVVDAYAEELRDALKDIREEVT